EPRARDANEPPDPPGAGEAHRSPARRRDESGLRRVRGGDLCAVLATMSAPISSGKPAGDDAQQRPRGVTPARARQGDFPRPASPGPPGEPFQLVEEI